MKIKGTAPQEVLLAFKNKWGRAARLDGHPQHLTISPTWKRILFFIFVIFLWATSRAVGWYGWVPTIMIFVIMFGGWYLLKEKHDRKNVDYQCDKCGAPAKLGQKYCNNCGEVFENQ